MKRILFIGALLSMLFSIGNAQFLNRTVQDDSVTSVSATAVYLNIELSNAKIGESIFIQGECSNIGGTSEGTITFLGSLDGLNYHDLNATTYPDAGFNPNDTVTIIDNQGYSVYIPVNGLKYIRTMVVGGANDTTGVDQDYITW